MDSLTSFILDEALIVIPVLLVLGQIIKQTPRVPNWAIPYAILAFGVGITLLLVGVTIEAFIQGVLVSGAAVFGNQLWQQGQRALDKDKEAS